MVIKIEEPDRWFKAYISYDLLYEKLPVTLTKFDNVISINNTYIENRNNWRKDYYFITFLVLSLTFSFTHLGLCLFIRSRFLCKKIDFFKKKFSMRFSHYQILLKFVKMPRKTNHKWDICLITQNRKGGKYHKIKHMIALYHILTIISVTVMH